MKIDRVVLRELHIPLVHFFETSFGKTMRRRIILVEVNLMRIRLLVKNVR